MKLAFLKSRRTPRSNPAQDKLQDSKLINGSPDDILDDHMIGELFDSYKSKNIDKFRAALAALTMNCFTHEDTEDAAD